MKGFTKISKAVNLVHTKLSSNTFVTIWYTQNCLQIPLLQSGTHKTVFNYLYYNPVYTNCLQINLLQSDTHKTVF